MRGIRSRDRSSYATATTAGNADGVHVRTTATGATIDVRTGPGRYKNLALARDGATLFYLSDVETYANDVPQYAAYVVDLRAAQPVAIAVAEARGAYAPSENGKPRFSKDGKRVFFGIAAVPTPLPSGTPEPTHVDLWSYRDGELQSQQKHDADAARKRTIPAMVDVVARRSVTLGVDGVRRVDTNENATVALLHDDRPYRRASSWIGDSYSDDVRERFRARVVRRCETAAADARGQSGERTLLARWRLALSDRSAARGTPRRPRRVHPRTIHRVSRLVEQFTSVYCAGQDHRRQPATRELSLGHGIARRLEGVRRTPRLGILYTPDGLDRARMHPMLVYFYDRFSDQFHFFRSPGPGTSPNLMRHVSDGYLVFTPHVTYETGHPGRSAMHSIMPGIDAVVARGLVDPKRIGIAGHSWAAYQINYMITQTARFRAGEAGAAVANMTSAYGGIRLESGVVREGQYEHGQSRIGAPPWARPDLYLENSGLFHIATIHTPYLTIHNDADGAVPWSQGINFSPRCDGWTKSRICSRLTTKTTICAVANNSSTGPCTSTSGSSIG